MSETKLTAEELDNLESHVKLQRAFGEVVPDVVYFKGATALSLIAAARELEELKSALVFLCEKDASVEVVDKDGNHSLCCTEPQPLQEMAKSLGWEPTNGR